MNGERGPSVVTVSWAGDGAREALEELHDRLGREPSAPHELVVVAVQAADLRDWEPDGVPVRVLLMSETEQGIPWGAAKNAGATAALSDGAEVVAFVAPDARFEPGTVDRVARAAREHVGLAWAPLDTDPERGAAPEDLAEAVFALSLHTWGATGGFCEEYAGPGWEDLDLARLAARHEVSLGPAAGATAGRAGGAAARDDDAESLARNEAVHERRWGGPPPSHDRGGW